MSNASESVNPEDREMPIDASFADGIDVDDEEDRWLGKVGPTTKRLHNRKSGEYRGW